MVIPMDLKITQQDVRAWGGVEECERCQSLQKMCRWLTQRSVDDTCKEPQRQ